MNVVEISRFVLENGCSIVRPRKDSEGYDVKVGGKKKGWFYLDSYSASAIVKVYEAINPENKVKFASLPVLKAAEIAFKLCK